MRRLAPALAFLTLLPHCAEEPPPRPQWQVHVTTDAPIPQVGDRLLVQILQRDLEGGLVPCRDCQRQLAADIGARFPVSFGITSPPSGGEVWARIRLYRSTETDSFGLPRPGLVIDHLGQLPPSPDGIADVHVPLDTRCLGVAADPRTEATCLPEEAARAPATVLPPFDATFALVPNTSPLATRTDCAGPAPFPNMKCIPGGLLVLGSSEGLPVFGPDLSTLPEQLVRLAPLWMDEDEYDVGSTRAWVEAGEIPAPALFEDCTYDTGDDDLPLNCVDHETAQMLCELEGKSLPTEAQWEHAASNAGRESPFPFDVALTSSSVLCPLALVATANDAFGEGSTTCTGILATGLEADAAPADVNDFGVRNLAGSVSEWVLDDFRAYSDPACWSAGLTILDDPVCDAESDLASFRGGNWFAPPFLARVSSRNATLPTQRSANLGFRCVAPDTP